ncbi:putative dehydrogenase [Arthrobacter sp. V1I9]|uniref:Gfo/Idh/MocA family protein n=1 Tax=Arthrobacter sp. V1I9 TaxID=3042275 RepID=UPI0027932798|nr:Gfo/Idh/MocA family oxidoreductase [Arthrobacter sp. V1I9]MDQ0870077.1 putative dehydrogenase [Arthrobacter sp. V1I9]
MSAPIAKPWLSSQPDQDPRSATGDPLRWGVIATGGIARSVSQDLAMLADAELYAVSSRGQETADNFAATYGFGRAYGDDGGIRGYERLLADDAVDVVYVATPHAQHHEVVLAALNAGKHVLCEKAFTVNAREASELIDLARSRNLFLMEAVWSRFLPGMQRAFEIAASGEIGDIHWVTADLGFPAPYSPTARLWARQDGGGALLDLSVYPLLWALGTLGFPQTVSATGDINDDGVDAQNALTLGYNHGAQAQLTSSLLAHGPRTATVAGSKGFLQSIGSINNPQDLVIGTGREERRVEKFDAVGRGYTYELREVTRCIQQGLIESPVMPLEDTLNTMRLFDGVRAQLGVSYPNDERQATKVTQP